MAVFFIRHGQSEFNAVFQGTHDPMIFDAPLTALGFEQATQKRATVDALKIDRVVTSPLTRAIQTAKTMFDGLAPIEVQHGHHEYLQYSGDVGRPANELQRDFPELTFDHLPEVWWHSDRTGNNEIAEEPEPLFRSRIEKFVATLDNIGDENVAYVGHGVAFGEVIGFMLKNCQIHKYR